MSTTKVGKNITNLWKLLFSLYHIKPIIFILKTKFAFHKQYFFPLLKRLEQTKVFYAFSYTVWKETTHKYLKEAAAKALFYSVYNFSATCFDECFFIL